jgi:hypothetical protein
MRKSAMCFRANRLFLVVRLCNKGASPWQRRQKRKQKRRRKSEFSHWCQPSFDADCLSDFEFDYKRLKTSSRLLFELVCHEWRGSFRGLSRHRSVAASWQLMTRSGQRVAGSIRPCTAEADDLCPFPGVGHDQRSEVGGRASQRDAPEIG